MATGISDSISVLLNQTSPMPGDLDGDVDTDDLPHYVYVLLGNPPEIPALIRTVLT